LHNIYFYLELVKQARQAIQLDSFQVWRQEFHQRYHENSQIEEGGES